MFGALKLVAWADGTLSPEESANLREVVAQAGDRGEPALIEARKRVRGAGDLKRLAAHVLRPAARAYIFQSCAALARADGYDDTELDVLDWLDELWPDH